MNVIHFADLKCVLIYTNQKFMHLKTFGLSQIEAQKTIY